MEQSPDESGVILSEPLVKVLPYMFLFISIFCPRTLRLMTCLYYRSRFYQREARFLGLDVYTHGKRQSMGSGAQPPGAEA